MIVLEHVHGVGIRLIEKVERKKGIGIPIYITDDMWGIETDPRRDKSHGNYTNYSIGYYNAFPGLGTFDGSKNLIHENAEIVVKVIYRILEILGKYIGPLWFFIFGVNGKR